MVASGNDLAVSTYGIGAHCNALGCTSGASPSLIYVAGASGTEIVLGTTTFSPTVSGAGIYGMSVLALCRAGICVIERSRMSALLSSVAGRRPVHYAVCDVHRRGPGAHRHVHRSA